MRRYVLIPDSFKGTLSSKEVCEILAEEIRRLDPSAAVCAIPVADGGEGTVDAFLTAIGGERVTVRCKGPYLQELDSFYGVLPDGTAVIEMAAAAGLPLVGADRRVADATTYGVGQLMAHALERGCTGLVLGLGGSATNDGGCGAAAALGYVFENRQGEAFLPTGGTLGEIAHIRAEKVHPLLHEAEVTVMCDIDNPLCGTNGAAAVFAPQKGADGAMVRLLDDGLRHLAAVIRRDLGAEVEMLPGSGAAGGFGGGAVAFFGGALQMGIDAVLALTNFDRRAADADLILTGEGHLDAQSLRGKVVIGVARRAKKLGVPAVALVGGSDTDIAAAYDEGLCGVFPIHPSPAAPEEASAASRKHLRFTAQNLLRFFESISPERA